MSVNIFNAIGGSSEGNYLIPARDPGSVTGSQFVQNNLSTIGAAREQYILDEFLHGNVPDFLRKMAEVTVTSGTNSITYMVNFDYLSIGTDQNFCRMPMAPLTAQKIANKYDCTLPTRKMVNDIWKNAQTKLSFKNTTPDAKMITTGRYLEHNTIVNNQLGGMVPEVLIAGHKKDVVLTNKLAPNNPKKRVAIYGWFYPDGRVVQDLNPSDHDDMYVDYSHGIRLISNDVIVNGKVMRIQDVFKDPILSSLVSDEGILNFLKY